MLRDLVRDVAAGVKGRVRGLALRVVEDIGRRGDTAALARRVADLNARLSAMEPHGRVVDVCRVCGGEVRPLVLGVVVPVDGVSLRRDILRCGRCWALRVEHRADEGEGPRKVSA